MRQLKDECMYELNEMQALKAMVKFLELYYEQTNSDDVGSLLSEVQTLSDGSTADPAAWNSWLKSVEKILKEEKT